MSTGFAVFLACLALGAVCAVISVHRAAVRLGNQVAAKYAAVLAVSLASYAAGCLVLGYGAGAQFIGAAASFIPLRVGRRYLPSLDDMKGGTTDDQPAA